MIETVVSYEECTELVLKPCLNNLEPRLSGLCIYINTICIWFNPHQQVANSIADPLTAQDIWHSDTSTNISVLGFQSKYLVHM